MSQEPADPTASSAPPDGTLPTIPSAGADVQPERVADEATGGDATIEAQAATPVGPPAEPAGTSGATSAAILAAVTAADTETAETAAATEPLASAEPAPAAETAETGSAAEPPAAAAVEPADAGPSRRGPWRPIAGILALVLLAAALGFAGAFLVPVLVDVPVPNGAVATTPAVSPTPAPTATVTATPSPSRSPQPTGSPPASPTPQSSSTIYIVQRGDILSAIANRFGVTVQAIVAANGLKDPNHIEPGQRLIIPPP